jgi:hypothetical protein
MVHQYSPIPLRQTGYCVRRTAMCSLPRQTGGGNEPYAVAVRSTGTEEGLVERPRPCYDLGMQPAWRKLSGSVRVWPSAAHVGQHLHGGVGDAKLA